MIIFFFANFEAISVADNQHSPDERVLFKSAGASVGFCLVSRNSLKEQLFLMARKLFDC